MVFLWVNTETYSCKLNHKFYLLNSIFWFKDSQSELESGLEKQDLRTKPKLQWGNWHSSLNSSVYSGPRKTSISATKAKASTVPSAKNKIKWNLQDVFSTYFSLLNDKSWVYLIGSTYIVFVLSSSNGNEISLFNTEMIFKKNQKSSGCRNIMQNDIPGGSVSGKESACQCRRRGFDPWVWKILWRRKWQPNSVFLPGESHGQRSLGVYSPLDFKSVRHD